MLDGSGESFIFQRLDARSHSQGIWHNGCISLARDACRTHIDAEEVFYGQVLNRMHAASTALSQDNVRLQSQETDLVGADMAKTATDLLQTQRLKMF